MLGVSFFSIHPNQNEHAKPTDKEKSEHISPLAPQSINATRSDLTPHTLFKRSRLLQTQLPTTPPSPSTTTTRSTTPASRSPRIPPPLLLHGIPPPLLNLLSRNDPLQRITRANQAIDTNSMVRHFIANIAIYSSRAIAFQQLGFVECE